MGWGTDRIESWIGVLGWKLGRVVGGVKVEVEAEVKVKASGGVYAWREQRAVLGKLLNWENEWHS
jgi:hypothetical protein